jgi:enoyl-CoA hydratase
MSYATVILERKDRVGILTLNRPDALNAMNADLKEDACEALDVLQVDENIDVVILTGAGRAFCAGLDLKEIGAQQDKVPGGPSIIDKVLELTKPVIGAVNGFAITGGFELALSCDILIASENAKFADTHARVGILPGSGMTQILPRLVGIKKAKELSFSGNFMTAQEAYQFGLVNRVVPPDDLMTTTLNLAEDILSADQWMVRKIKELIDKGEGMTLEDAMRLEKYEHLRHIGSVSPGGVEERRKGILQRGRKQSQEA